MIGFTKAMKHFGSHLALATVSLLGTAFWVDGLLYVGKPVAQAVLSTEALEKALDEADEAQKPDEPAKQDKPPQEAEKKEAPCPAQKATASEQPQASPPPVETEDAQQVAEATVAPGNLPGETPGPLPVVTEVPPPAPPLAATPPASPPLPPATGATTPVPPVAVPQAQPLPLADATTAGGVVSFVGQGLSGTASDQNATGALAGFVFEIRFAPPLNWETLQRISGVLPVVVRQRRDFKEVALVLENGRVAEPVALPELIRQRPEYEGCWAILLPRERLADVLEQTINHGSGWEPCCLVEDRRFSQWISAARDFASARRQPPERIAGFQADAYLVRAPNGADLRLVFRNLVLREATP